MRGLRVHLACITLVLSAAALPGSAQALVYGLKSHDDPDGTQSKASVRLFSFTEDGLTFTSIADVTVGGSPIDADGLAISSSLGLLGFRLDYSDGVVSGSTLVSINPVTAAGTAATTSLTEREIRGAVYAQGQLWVIDQTANQLLRVDPTTGAEIPSSAVTLSLTLSVLGTDIAYRSDKQFYLTNSNKIYTLDVSTGVLSLVKTDADSDIPLGSLARLAGATFSDLAPEGRLFTYDIGGADDIFRYATDVGGIPRSDVFLNIISSYDAGRGDLAAIATPEPTSLLLFGTTLAGLAAYYRRRRSDRH